MKSHLQHQWFETFFQGPAVDFWTRAIPPALTLADVDFLEKTFDVKQGARLLDVPCGNGRHSIELARRGYRVTGIDLSDEFLAAARAELDADWRKGDMRELELESSTFDGAFCFGNSFGYLDHAGVESFLAALAGALKPAAKLVIETGVTAESDDGSKTLAPVRRPHSPQRESLRPVEELSQYRLHVHTRQFR